MVASMRSLVGLALVVCLAGCATGTRAVITDVAQQCGVKVGDAVIKTKHVLLTATSADAAMAEIADILGAASSDAAAIYCVISEAVKSLKAQRSLHGGTATAQSQMRAMSKDTGASLPSDPTAHGIALGEDLLHEQARFLVVSTVGAP